MDVDYLLWRHLGMHLEDERIHEVEEQLCVKFPIDFVEVVKTYHGASPKVSDFDYLDERKRKNTGGLGRLLSFDAQAGQNILNVNKIPPEGLPQGLILWGMDGGGGFLAFDYRLNHLSPSVVYWISDYH